MQINLQKGKIGATETDLVVMPVFKRADFKEKPPKDLPGAMLGRFAKSSAVLDFCGKLSEKILLQAEPAANFDALLIIGLGEKSAKDQLAEALRTVCGEVVALAKKAGYKKITVFLPTKDFSKEEYASAVVLAALLADYTFDAFKKEKNTQRLTELNLLFDDGKQLLKCRRAVERAEILGDSITVARDLVNMPAQVMTPKRLVLAATELVKAADGLISLKVLSKAECEKLGMGAYLAVAQGSDEEPKFLHLTYNSPRKAKQTVAVLGKGVTFDSGGLSLKPADAMMTMKCDMAGAASVIGLFAALARLRPRVNVHGIIAATENMPSGKAIRPGDVVKSMNGKTIEILNTDAEGRLTLADAMTYTLKEVKPDVMIDLATLTGACVVALGEEIAGLMTNDRGLAKQLLGAAKEGGEKLWELPLEPRYKSLIVSEVADLKNIAGSRYGGSVTAGLFLEEFAEDKPWAHLDIAGPAFAERPMASYLGKGGTGYGIRTLVHFLEQLEK